MGIYLNPYYTNYEMTVKSDIFVDKSLLIHNTNAVLNKTNRFICVSRPRRFGKSTDANMLVAYYSKGCDSHHIFDDLNVSFIESYEEHLNRHNVIHLNMQNFLSDSNTLEEMVGIINEEIIFELQDIYSVKVLRSTLRNYLNKVTSIYQEKFIFIIDEWDCIFREYKEDRKSQEKYLDFLRDLLKDQPYVELCYMTGILPIKKYGTHSALNMFDEISMIEPRNYSQFMGFTEEEVKNLCCQYELDFSLMKEWYDGYHLEENISIYSPRSVTSAISTKKFSNYWSQTETFEALQDYIDLNFEGLKDDVIAMIANEKRDINIRTFQNDMITFHSKDDVLTLLVHLGYLSYDAKEKKVYIPNNEVKDSFIDTISVSNWGSIQKIFNNSKELLKATWQMDQEKVAKYIQESHYETSILQYNDENALAYTIYLAYITAKEYYTIIRELPTGKGFADIVFIPKGNKPAMIIELKYDQDVKSGIIQIKDKQYPKALEQHLNNLLLVSINYDKQSKKHQCIIEKYQL